MACYHPWVKSFPDGPRSLPCGQCIGCRLEYARGWAVRIMAEASLHERNSFLTLSYNAEHLPAHGSLVKRAVPLFMGRLRARRRVRRLNPATGRMKRYAGPPVRYFQAGEYGEERGRPHYHVVLFGEDFHRTRVPFKRKGAQFPEWISSELLELWPHGHHLIGSVSFESASYVARYVCERKTGPEALVYEEVDPGTGEVVEREREFATMSRAPGIGAGWLERFRSDVYPSDEVRMSGAVSAPPRYFDSLLERLDPDLHARVTHDRKVRPFRKPYERSPERLQVREVCAEAQLNLFRRKGI